VSTIHVMQATICTISAVKHYFPKKLYFYTITVIINLDEGVICIRYMDITRDSWNKW